MQMMLADLLLLRLERAADAPRNRQLYKILRETILDGSLSAGTRLPPTRDLAKDLGVSRNTVLYAYEQLLAEGYVVARTGSGTFVADTCPDRDLLSVKQQEKEQPDRGEFSLSHRGATLVRHARASRTQWGAFMPGVPDVDAFPHKIWSQLVAKQWRNPKRENLIYGHGGGHPALKEALAQHLRMSRSVNCDASQIVITDGIHQAISLCVQMLTDVENRAWVEDPGYWGIRNILTAMGLRISSIPVDREGMNPSPTDMQRPPRLIFVTPSHQYPLGHMMSIARRRMLLEFANRHGSWVVEDDYDSEFRYGGSPLAAMQGIEENARVLYTGTFSKTLFPGLRIGYLVVPKPLVDAFQGGISELYREGRWMTQAALADFINEGHYAAHIRRMRQLYGKRRSMLLAATSRHIGPDAILSADSNAGLHLVLGLPAGLSDCAISTLARDEGLIALPLSRYYMQQDAQQGFVLGYGSIKEEQIDPALAQLARLIQSEYRRL